MIKLSKSNKLLIGGQLILIIVILLLARSCHNNQLEAENNKYKLAEYLEERQTFVSVIDKNKQEIATQKQVTLSKDRELEKQLLENSNLKRLNTQIKVKMETEIANVIAKYEKGSFITGIDTVFTENTDTVFIEAPIGVKFGTKFNLIDPWYQVGGSITQGGVLFDSLSFKNDLTITVGRKREKWNKPLVTYVEVLNANPYSSINSLNNITIKKDKETIWTKPWFNLVVGFTGGFVIGVVASN